MAPDPKNNVPAAHVIRQYLLGRLNDQEELEKSLSQQIFHDDELAEIVGATEDEIIEDYLDDALSKPDRLAVESYFLRPAERRKKLHYARLLRRHFRAVRPALDKKVDAPVPSATNWGAQHGLMFHFRSHVRTYCELAALLLLSASVLTYLATSRHGLQLQLDTSLQNQRKLEGELAQQRQLTAGLTRKLEEYAPPTIPLPFTLGTLRGPGAARRIEIKPYTRRIAVEFDLRGASANIYDVHLKSDKGKEIWSATGLPRSPSDLLHCEIPVQDITNGYYHLTVTAQPLNKTTGPYSFQVEIRK